MASYDLNWPMPTTHPILGDDAVHVWCVSLDVTETEALGYRSLLAEDESRRADRFRFSQDRLHFIVARGVLRVLLGRYLDLAPEQVQFAYNHYGKPALAGAHEPHLLRFNLSHSGSLALYAFARQRELGIDIEWNQRRIDLLEQIASRYFSRSENEALWALPQEEQRQAFFTCWTRKEAYIKARGRGLSLPLDQFDVSLSPSEPARILATRDDPAQAARWTMHALAPHPDYPAAIVIEGQGWRLHCWQWRG